MGANPAEREKEMIMKVGKRRKDGKYPVQFKFSNGVQLNIIFTAEQLEKEKTEQKERQYKRL